MSRNNTKRNTTIVATILFAISTLTVVLAPAGFGRGWRVPSGGMINSPVVDCPSGVAYAGDSTTLYVSTGDDMLRPDGRKKDATQYVHIYSNPLGAVSYDGPINGSSDVIDAAVSPNAPQGQVVQIILETQDGGSAATTAVVQ